MKNARFTAIMAILAAAIIFSFGLPRTKYRSFTILPRLNIPLAMKEWHGTDVSKQLNLKDERYNFISDVFARAYRNYIGESILFLILDAGNFHNPKVCLGSSGYATQELPDIEYKTPAGSFKAHASYFEKKGEGLLVIYWICINKKIVDWNAQKVLQLWYSLFNKEKVGLMVRFDIPTEREKIRSSMRASREFVGELAATLPQDQAEYLFGKK